MLLLAVASLLGACALPPAPPVRWYRLPPRAAAAEGARVPNGAAAARWELHAVRVPDYLDRRALLMSDGGTVLTALEDDRWAEPLREALPRALHEDLEAGLGMGSVLWRPDTAARSQVTHLIDVEIVQLDANPRLPAAVLKARWQLRPRSGSSLEAPPWAAWQEGHWSVSARSATPSDLVLAQREALAALAQRILAGAPLP